MEQRELKDLKSVNIVKILIKDQFIQKRHELSIRWLFALRWSNATLKFINEQTMWLYLLGLADSGKEIQRIFQATCTILGHRLYELKF